MRSDETAELTLASPPKRTRSANTFPRVLQSLKWRLQLAPYGIFYLPGREIAVRSVRIGDKTVPIAFPDGERAIQKFELVNLVYLDCYRLARVRGPVSSVLDIGANLGFFALAARRRFPHARIHCYEPNPDLEPNLSAHCTAVGADYFLSAVGAAAGRVNLDVRGNSLHSVSLQSPDGSTAQVAFAEAVARLGTVDVLKLDCEGAEWDIFNDQRPWANVRHLTMEYHLWARPSLTIDHLRRQLTRLGFAKIVIEPDRDGDWGLAWAAKA